MAPVLAPPSIGLRLEVPDHRSLVSGSEAAGVGAASIGASVRLLHRTLEAAVSEGLVASNRAQG